MGEFQAASMVKMRMSDLNNLASSVACPGSDAFALRSCLGCTKFTHSRHYSATSAAGLEDLGGKGQGVPGFPHGEPGIGDGLPVL